MTALSLFPINTIQVLPFLLTGTTLTHALAHPAAPSPAFSPPPPLPLNWTTVLPCATDTPARVLTGVSTHLLAANNTPAACIELCDALAPGDYTYAGVEYANECHCGTGLVSPAPQPAPAAECDMGCTGDPDLSCGGSWRIQIYKSPALPPGSWTLQGCFLDTPASPALAHPAHHAFPSNLDLVGQCIDYCTHAGLPWAGVEDAQDCQCSGSGFASGGGSASTRASATRRARSRRGRGTSIVAGSRG
ncbi:hypothetical protein C8T65DRAFT_78211 [Cerioporus squamosus]|nr:hypothetical protein C8T65DRAFT_78211 [Cerioporus squamosus]